jgi:transposase
MLPPRGPVIKPAPLSPFALPPWTKTSCGFRRILKDLQNRKKEHLALKIDRAVDLLDLRPLRATYAGVGTDAHDPKLLLKAVLYEMHMGYHSPAKWYSHAFDNNPVRWLLRGLKPSRSSWYDFRDRVGPLLLEFNRQVLAMAGERKVTQGQRGALDGSFVAANASRRKMLKGNNLRERLQQLQQACLADERGETLAERPGWMGPTVKGRRRQLPRYQQAVDRCQQREERQQRQRACDRNRAQPVRVNPSDPDAVPGRDKERVYRPLYNPQLLRDVDSPLILSYDVFAQATDAGTLEPMFARTRLMLGWLPPVWLTDSSYATGPQLRAAELAQVTLYAPWQAPGGAAGKKPPAWLPKESFRWVAAEQAYHCPAGRRMELQQVITQQRAQEQRVVVEEYRCESEYCLNCPLAAWCTPRPEKGRTVNRSEHDDRFERLQQRMATPEAKALYKKRSQTVELSYADMKWHRKLWRFSGKGLTRVRIEIGLFVLVHNLLVVEAAPVAAPASK